MLWSFYSQGKSPWYPLDRRLDESHGHGGEEKNSQPLAGLKPPIIQPVAQHYTTETCRLLEIYQVYCRISLNIFIFISFFRVPYKIVLSGITGVRLYHCF
jgi:hypothetical protein